MFCLCEVINLQNNTHIRIFQLLFQEADAQPKLGALQNLLYELFSARSEEDSREDPKGNKTLSCRDPHSGINTISIDT